MELEAIYENGRLEFTKPVRFLQDKVRVRVLVSDDVVSVQSGLDESHEKAKTPWPDSLKERSKQLKDRLDRIRTAPLPSDNDLPEMTQKQRSRMEAFAIREELRKDR
ncbi:MAG: hypothetical protein K9K64_03530 [Desulfohalobiaceae bacterium]|nr:hypothetical protein [Desulfohalobiaceae bacterium]